MNKLNLFFSAAMIVLTLSACGKSAKDLKISEISIPENQKMFLEELTPEDRKMLQSYIMSKGSKIDYNVRIGDAIEEQRKN